jgi:single-strand DNA-binding protein
LISVAGRIQVRNYDAKDGTKRYVTEVIAEEVQFIEWAKREDTDTANPDYSTEVKFDNEDDIPF